MVALPEIGLASQVVHRAKWYKFIGRLGFKAVEINRQHSKLQFNLYFLEKIKRYMAGFDLSVHSGTSGIFQARESFTGAELAMLTAEIDLCRYLGAGQLVFHLRDGFLSGADKRKLKDVFSRAAEAGVTPLYESNSALTAEYAYDVLDSLPQVGYVLDLGHLNNGRGRGVLGCSVDDFIGQVRDRVVYVHANNNSGFRDEHHGLENGSLDWRRVFDRLDLSRIVKIIIEVRGVEMVDRTAAELTAYLESRRLPQKRCAFG